jgi:hypothetical protein
VKIPYLLELQTITSLVKIRATKFFLAACKKDPVVPCFPQNGGHCRKRIADPTGRQDESFPLLP